MNSRKSQYARKRTFSAIILLMVMMLQMGVRVIHHHHHAEQETVTCSDCEHHRIHDGHILNWGGDDSCCVICQLFSSPFCGTEEIRIDFITFDFPAHFSCPVAKVIGTAQMHISPRAPPVSSL